MGFVSSIIVVDDVLRSRKLYENIMHMRVVEDHGIYNVGFEGGLSLYQKALFQNLTDDLKLLTHSNNFVLYFEVDDPLALEKEIISHGFEFVHPLREQPWKQYVFRFYDYDGHLLEVAEKMDAVLDRINQ